MTKKYQLDSQFTSNYFQRSDVVASWWEPERPGTHVKLKQQHIYVREREKVVQLAGPHGKIILDVGTGKGRFAINFARNGAAKVVGVDVNKEMIAIAVERCKAAGLDKYIDFQIADVAKLPFKDNSFDVVVCIQTFMHLPNPYDSLLELKRVVKPCGRIIVDHENVMPYWRITHGSIRSLGFLLLRSIISRQKRIMTGIRKSEFLEMFKACGLDILSVHDFGPNWCPAYFLCCCIKE